ncbi:unnamed protein product, partial [Rotaria socialis]
FNFALTILVLFGIENLKKQIQNHRFTSMVHQTEHDSWLEVSFPKAVRRVFERVWAVAHIHNQFGPDVDTF